MGTKWTKEQLLAIETRGCNLLVAAAAGSGKTAVLVERIIRMITDEEKPVDIDRLLVVTFTNAAASEMRERIGDAISKELEKDPTSSTLQRQLALLNRASITTMHSFCLDVIKNNFHLIDLDPNFRIGDDTECALIKQELLVDLFEEKYEEGDKNFLALVEAYGGSKSDEKLHDTVLKLYNFSMSGPWPEEWLKEKAEEFNISNIDELDSKAWVSILKQSMSIEVESMLSMLTQASNICENTGGLEPYLENINGDMIQIENVKDSLNKGLSQIQKSISCIKFSTLKRVKKADIEDENAQEKVKEIRDLVKKDIKELKEKVFSVELDEAIIGINRMYLLMKCLTNLVIEFSYKYTEKKREKSILDFNDLEHLCLKILINMDEEKNVLPSKVALELREKFEEVLVDEYQDSNNVQETLIDMVSRKTTDNPNVFMVGDVKQSIYRFRQAKPELFLEKYNTYKEIENKDSRKIMLYKNFRSRNEVIQGANYVFKVLMSDIVGELKYDEKEALNLGADYKNVEESTVLLLDEELDEIKVAGDIELHILDKSAKKDEEIKDNEDVNEDESLIKEEEDLDAIQLEARIVANRINELMNATYGNTYMVWDKQINKYRKLKFKDIVILLRATKNWAETFVEELSIEGIPVYADTGTGYFQSIEIRTMMAILHVIDNPLQDIYIISALRSPIFDFNAEQLADIRLLDKKKYFYENIKDICEGKFDDEVSQDLKKKCLYFNKSLIKWREKSAYTPIDEFIWYIYTDTSYFGYVGAMPNGVQRQANLRILFQRAKQYEKTSFKGLFNFINFINKLKKSSGDLGSAKILGENEDVVRIMSIHKSKGLEFPVVFLSGSGKQFNLMDLKNNLLFHEDLGIGADCIDVEKRISYPTLQKYAIKKKFELETLSEEMRILYVAFTRAKEKLIITGASSDIIKSCEKWNKAAMVDDKFEISPSKVMKGKSYLDWIGMAMAKHPHGKIIREIGNGDIKINSQELSTWNIKIWSKSDVFVDEMNEIVDNFEGKKLFIDEKVNDVNEEIKERLNYKYKYNESCNMPSNISVSDIKKAEYEEIEEQSYNMYKSPIKKKPRFIQEDKGLSAAEKGTIIHFVMQNLELDKVNNLNEIKNQINYMKSCELLTEEQFSVVNAYKIRAFFKDELGKRLLKAFKEDRSVQRELPFLTEIPSTKVNKELNEKIYGEEKLRLQGIIDCFFEEDDGIVLLDYKTDYVEVGDENEILDRYKVQIDLYSNTVEKITGKKVKEKFLYLFYLEKSVKYNC